MSASLKSAMGSRLGMGSSITKKDASKITFGTSKKIFSQKFEVFGKVQRVFFRKYLQKEANRLMLTGWCMNTTYGTVKGVIEGPANEVSVMKHWLQTRGSPKSRIERAVFAQIEELPNKQYTTFTIRR